MRTWTVLLVTLIWGACSSGSGAKDATINQPDARPNADTNGLAGDVADAATKPAGDVADAVVDSGNDAVLSDTIDAAKPDIAETAAWDVGQRQDAADDAWDAPSDTQSADLGSDDAGGAYCGVAITGSCLFDTPGMVECTDYTDTDPTVGASRCGADASGSGVWSPQPCPLARPGTGCRRGTQGVPGCSVTWRQPGSANYEVWCQSTRGFPIQLY
jgi:hypothetical protein